LTGHHALVGTNQPTASSLTLADGTVEGLPHTFALTAGAFRRDGDGVLERLLRGGDGTVPDNSALPRSVRPATLAQQHGALAHSPEGINAVCDVIGERDPDADRLGDGQIGIELPDMVAVGAECVVTVTGLDGRNDATVTVHRDDDPIAVGRPRIGRADGRWQATVLPERPGIYRITVAGGGTTPVTQLVLAFDPDDEP
jgi:hypothetical protein